jgi:hypothetical protein
VENAGDGAAGGAEDQKKRGRPPGSRNRRSVNWVEEWNQRHGSSLERLWPLVTGDPVKVVKRLKVEFGLSSAEALSHIRWAVETLAQYQHQRIAPAKGVVVDERDLLHMHFLAVKGASAPGATPDPAMAPPEEQARPEKAKREEHLRAMKAAQAAVDAAGDEVLPNPMEQALRVH